MLTLVLIVYCFIVIALVGVVLMQRSEGGALGIGGGGGPGGGFMSGRAAATALTRTTTVLAALYMGTCLTLAVLADDSDPNQGLSTEILGEDAGTGNNVTPGAVTGDDLLEGFGETPAGDDIEPAPSEAEEPQPEATEDGLEMSIENVGQDDTSSGSDEPADEDTPQ